MLTDSIKRWVTTRFIFVLVFNNKTLIQPHLNQCSVNKDFNITFTKKKFINHFKPYGTLSVFNKNWKWTQTEDNCWICCFCYFLACTNIFIFRLFFTNCELSYMKYTTALLEAKKILMYVIKWIPYNCMHTRTKSYQPCKWWKIACFKCLIVVFYIGCAVLWPLILKSNKT